LQKQVIIELFLYHSKTIVFILNNILNKCDDELCKGSQPWFKVINTMKKWMLLFVNVHKKSFSVTVFFWQREQVTLCITRLSITKQSLSK